MSDLFYGDGLAKERWRAYIENREKRKIEAVYNYASINGDYAYTKVRLEGKKMLFGILSNERFAYGLNGKNKKTFNAVYGSISSIKRAIERKEPVFIPEGEKDVNTLVKKGYAAFSCGGANDWNKNVSELCKDADVIVLTDNDDPGKKLASTVVRDLKGTAKSIRIIIPMPEVPKADITDYFEAGHTVEEFENLIRNVDDTEKICADVQQDQKQDIGKKRSVIQKNKDEVAGGPALVFKFLDCNYDEDGNVKSVKQLVHNFEVVMDKDSRFAGKIRLNEFAQQPYLYGSVPWENENNCRAWSSHDDSALFSLIQADYGLKSRQDFADALKNVSMRNKFHPVRELLDSLTWDGKEHIRSLLPEYLGAEDSDYTYQVMRLWMLGAVSRVYKPGSKFDYTIILQGSQGIGKSTFLKLMALDDSWFNDSLDSLDSDKAVQSLTGSWIIELAELKSLARTAGGVESVKRFLTATQDKYRIPYERRADTFYRQCVFAGTTNKDDFLQDETGNRRFLIIHTGVTKPFKSLFTPEVMDDMKQAWAEAVHIWKNEDPQLILPENCMQQAKELQEANMADDGKRGIILDYLEGKTQVCDSLQVAEKFGKRHSDVIRAIENLLANDSTQNCVQCIKPSKYKDASGKYNKKYLLNKDGFVFLAFGFTGKEADAWKWKYIDAFNRMERLVYEKNTAAYQIADQEERTTRRAETDVIKEFVEYARMQGSTHADHYYSNYTRLAYKSVGITDKTTAAGSQLDDLALVEHLITHTLRTGMAAGHNYKDIYQDCKNRLEAMRYLQCTA